MADYTALPNSAVGIGGIPSGTTITALRDNPIAIAERSVGAPKAVDDYEFISRTVVSGTVAAVTIAFDPTDYDSVVFYMSNVRGTAQVSLNMLLSADSGSTFSSTYAHRIDEMGGTFAETTSAVIPLVSNVGRAAGESGVSGQVTVFGPASAFDTHVFLNASAKNLNGVLTVVQGAAQNDVQAVTNAVRFLFASGSVESGTITAYGLRTS